MSAEDPGLVKQLLDWTWTIAAAAVAFVWKDAQRRQVNVEEKIETKADKNEIERHRDYIGKIFEKLEEHARSDDEKFGRLFDTIHRNHAELLTQIGHKADR